MDHAPSPAPADLAPDLPSDRDAAAPGTLVLDLPLRPLPASAAFGWLKLGWRDFVRAPGIGLFYGSCFAGMGWILLWTYRSAPAWVLALSAGFLLMGPFLCLGLYDASRRLERGEAPDLGASLIAWESRAGTMAIFGGVLLILEMLWGRASLIVFAVSFDGMPDFKGSLTALIDPENLGFIVAYLGVGAILAGLIFAISVVSIPMILDRSVDAVSAGLTSLRLCLTQPLPMLVWGATITVLVVLALLPGFLGLLVVGPVVGHASWHAYRGAVGDAETAADAKNATVT